MKYLAWFPRKRDAIDHYGPDAFDQLMVDGRVEITPGGVYIDLR